jgi:hypothetical protein
MYAVTFNMMTLLLLGTENPVCAQGQKQHGIPRDLLYPLTGTLAKSGSGEGGKIPVGATDNFHSGHALITIHEDLRFAADCADEIRKLKDERRVSGRAAADIGIEMGQMLEGFAAIVANAQVFAPETELEKAVGAREGDGLLMLPRTAGTKRALSALRKRKMDLGVAFYERDGPVAGVRDLAKFADEPTDEVNGMNADIQQGAASGSGGIEIGIGTRPIVLAALFGFHPDHVADEPIVKEALKQLDILAESTVVADAQLGAATASGVNHILALGNVASHGLFAKNVNSVIQEFTGKRGMEVVGNGNHGHIDVADQVLHLGGPTGETLPICEPVSPDRIGIHNHGGKDLRNATDGRHVVASGDRTRAHKAQTQPISHKCASGA